jgi:hypothetical protein
MVTDWREYASSDPHMVVVRLSEVYQELAGLATEVAMIRSAERRAKVEGWQRSQDTSVTARNRDADHNALELTTTLFELQGQVEALQAERDLLRLCLEVQ